MRRMSTPRHPDLYLSRRDERRGEARLARIVRGQRRRRERSGFSADAIRLWRLITVIGPAVITATFKDTRAVSIQKYNNSRGASRGDFS